MTERVTIKPPPHRLRELVIASVVGFGVSTYYSFKLTRAEQIAAQAEAQLKQIQREPATSESTPAKGAPTDLVCPDGTTLAPVRDILGTQKTDWECIGKPKRMN